MKVLDIYGKEDFDLITYNGKLILDLMNSFFLKFPKSYREIYDKNLETLEIHFVDEMVDIADSAQYYPSSNVLMFKSFAAIPHEFMHLCSSDRVNKRFAFCRDGEFSLFENALVEGMTEYLSCVMKVGTPDTYFFEYFVASMLSDIDRIFEPFFIPSYSNFISLFSNKRDICSLMYSLDFYHDKIQVIDDNSSVNDINRISDSVKSTIDNLIDIELSFNEDKKDRKMYGDKFMDLISNSDIQLIVGDVCPEYIDYAFHEIKKKILRRKR